MPGKSGTAGSFLSITISSTEETSQPTLVCFRRARGEDGSGGKLLLQQVVRWLRASLTVPHMNPHRVNELFGDKHHFIGIDTLENIVRVVGVPVDIRPWGESDKETCLGGG